MLEMAERRSGFDRRITSQPVDVDRRVGGERREQTVFPQEPTTEPVATHEQRDFGLHNLDIKEVVPGVAYSVDVNPILERANPNWQKEVIDLAMEADEKIIVGGSVATSLASRGFETRYHPTNGVKIQERLPWMVDLYRGDFTDLVAEIMHDDTYKLGTDLAHSLNMNLTKVGGYEPHVDRNPATVLLGVVTLNESEGGETIIWKDENRTEELARIAPRQGVAVIFNGHYAHEVTPFKPETPDRIRITMPGDYYNESHPEVVDSDFNRAIGVR